MNFIIELVGVILVLPFIIIETLFKLFLIIALLIVAIVGAIVYPIIPNKQKFLKLMHKLWKYATKFKQGYITGHWFEYWQVY